MSNWSMGVRVPSGAPFLEKNMKKLFAALYATLILIGTAYGNTTIDLRCHLDAAPEVSFPVAIDKANGTVYHDGVRAFILEVEDNTLYYVFTRNKSDFLVAIDFDNGNLLAGKIVNGEAQNVYSGVCK